MQIQQMALTGCSSIGNQHALAGRVRTAVRGRASSQQSQQVSVPPSWARRVREWAGRN